MHFSVLDEIDKTLGRFRLLSGAPLMFIEYFGVIRRVSLHLSKSFSLIMQLI